MFYSCIIPYRRSGNYKSLLLKTGFCSVQVLSKKVSQYYSISLLNVQYEIKNHSIRVLKVE